MSKNKTVKANETPEEKILRLELENEEYQGIIKDLMAQLDAKSGAKNNEVIVEHDGKKYHANIPSFRHNGMVYKNTDLADKPELVAELVEMKFGGLVEIIPSVVEGAE